MNNLKRVLSLALASVMLIGMMVVGASAADFSDNAEIENKEAVGTMVALNIINGYPDGTYKPEELLLREQAAKMVFVALNGGKTSENLTTKATPTFSDIKGNWAEGYIEWAYNRGILAGMGDGTFNPKGNLTGTQLAKVMLVAIGYNAKAEGLEGTNDWALNVNSLALQKGFFDGLDDLDPEANITRDQAAKLILNACKAPMVEYNSYLQTVNGVLSSTLVAQDRKTAGGAKITILKDKYDMLTESGVLTNVALQTNGTYIITTTGATYGSNNTVGQFTKVTEDYSALLGQTVTVLFEDNGDTTPAKAAGTIYGVYASDDNHVYTTKQSAIADADTAAGATDKIKFGGTTYTADAATVTVIRDGAAATAVALDSFVDKDGYDEITFVDNDDDGKIEYAVVTTVTPAKVTYASSTEVIADDGNTYKYAETDMTAGLKKGDYVTIVTSPVGANGKTKITKVEATTGTISGVKATTPKQYQIDGTWYAEGNTVTDAAAGSDGTFYIVNGVIYAGVMDDDTSIEDLVQVIRSASSGLTTQVKFMKTDGTIVTGNLATGATAPTGGNLYIVSTSGSDYKFTAVSDDIGSYAWLKNGAVATTTGLDTPGNAAKITTVEGVTIADDAIIMLASDEAATGWAGKVITGAQMKLLTNDTGTALTASTTKNGKVKFATNSTATGAFTTKVNGLTQVKIASFLVDDYLPATKDASESYGLVVASSYTVEGGTTFDVWTGSEKVTVVDADKHSVAAGDVILYSAITDGKIKDVTAVSANTSFNTGDITNVSIRATANSGKTLYLNGTTDSTNDYKLTDDTVIFYYDSAAMEGKTEGSIELADTVEGVFVENAKVIPGSGTRTIDFLLVDVKNKLASATGYTVTKNAATATSLQNIKVTYGEDDVEVAYADASSPTKLPAGTIVNVTVNDKATGKSYVEIVSGGKVVGSTALSAGFTGSADTTKTHTFQVVISGNLELKLTDGYTIQTKDASSTPTKLAWATTESVVDANGTKVTDGKATSTAKFGKGEVVTAKVTNVAAGDGKITVSNATIVDGKTSTTITFTATADTTINHTFDVVVGAANVVLELADDAD